MSLYERASKRVYRWDPYIEPGEDGVEFRLTYAGRLLSSHNDGRMSERSLHIHALRKHFHKQLRALWQKHPFFETIDRSPPGDWLFQHFMHDGFDWLPIVNKQNGMICKLDIIMLREGQPGYAVYDIDNRVKTIFDALRKADGPAELGLATSKGMQVPDADESPFFVLLEDDKLITHVSVSSDTLLEPVQGVPVDEAVRLLINVTISPYRVYMRNLGMS